MSHFSTIKTKLKNKPQLVEALEILQYDVKEDQELKVTGAHGINHETVEAEVAIGINLEFGCISATIERPCDGFIGRELRNSGCIFSD